jgi:hypothetical protein
MHQAMDADTGDVLTESISGGAASTVRASHMRVKGTFRKRLSLSWISDMDL